MIKAPACAAKGATWCGPYALATIAGITYEEALAKVKKVTHRKRITGMWNHEVESTAQKLGFKKFRFKYIPKKERTTLANSLDWLHPNRIYVVQITRHYVIVNTKDWTFTDNIFGGKWNPVSNELRSGRRRCVAFAEAYRIPDHVTSEPSSP